MTLPPNIAAWPKKWRELYEERAGIMEFQSVGTMSRQVAEIRAEQDIRKIAALKIEERICQHETRRNHTRNF